MITKDIETELLRLAAANNESLTAEAVLAAAAVPTSPLHSWSGFTWDTASAANKRNLDEARSLIRSVRVNVITTTHHVKAPYFMKDPTIHNGYASLPKLRTNSDMARDVIIAEFARATAALGRAKAVAAALGMSDQIEALTVDIAAVRAKLDDATATTSAAAN